MVKIKSQGILVLPFPRINELLKSLKAGDNLFHSARNIALERISRELEDIEVLSIDFEVMGNRVLVTSLTSGRNVKDTFRKSFDAVFAALTELMSESLKRADIENEDTLMAIRDITILEVEE